MSDADLVILLKYGTMQKLMAARIDMNYSKDDTAELALIDKMIARHLSFIVHGV